MRAASSVLCVVQTAMRTYARGAVQGDEVTAAGWRVIAAVLNPVAPVRVPEVSCLCFVVQEKYGAPFEQLDTNQQVSV